MSWLCDDDVNGTIKINKFKKIIIIKGGEIITIWGPSVWFWFWEWLLKKKNSNFLKKTKEKKTVDVKGSVSWDGQRGRQMGPQNRADFWKESKNFTSLSRMGSDWESP